MNVFHKVCSFVYALLGIVHCSFTPVFFHELAEPAIWYSGTGAALIAIGLYNMSVSSKSDRLSWWLCLIANIIGLTLSVLIMLVVRETQAFISIIVIGLITIAFIWDRLLPSTSDDTISYVKGGEFNA